MPPTYFMYLMDKVFMEYLAKIQGQPRKIPISKFLLSLLEQIYKALVYLIIQFLFEKEFSSDFGSAGLASQPARLAFRPLGPPGPPSSFCTEAGEHPRRRFPLPPNAARPLPPRSRCPELRTASADHFPLLPSSFQGLNTP
jgi:hypothetical protein